MAKHIFSPYILAAYPLLWVETHEEHRAIATLVKELDGRKPERSYFAWDCAEGLRPVSVSDGAVVEGKPIPVSTEGEGSGDPVLDTLNWIEGKSCPEYSVIFIKDFHAELHDSQNKAIYRRKIRNMIPRIKSMAKTVVIVSGIVNIPSEFEKEISVIPFGLPDRDGLRQVLLGTCEAAKKPGMSAKDLYPKKDEPILDAALGMTTLEAENAFAISLIEKKCFDSEVVRREKAAIVKKSGLLEVIDSPTTLSDIGGLELLKAWIVEHSKCRSQEAKDFGVDSPKGLLLIGVPGCGKSLTAKAVSSGWGLPLLRLDLGKVFGGIVGQSESNLRRVLAIADTVAPAVIWLDELEKAFAGVSSSFDGDSGVTKRIFGAFLTWMSEKTSDVFIVATANSVDALPPEFLRSGRFDQIYWIDLPDAVQRAEIINIHLHRKSRDPKKYQVDMGKLVTASEGFSGADIETWVKNGLTRAFTLGHDDLTVEDMLVAAGNVTPISRLMKEKIQHGQAWAKANGAKLASEVHKVAEVVEGPKVRKIEAA